MTIKNWNLMSSDEETELNVMTWQTEGRPRAILQIIHGMVDYIERYDRFAQAMNDEGIMVVGNDHLGHGYSAQSPDDFGYFADENGNEFLLQDVYKLYKHSRAIYPDLPYFILGHSMGSFYVRQFIYRFPDEALAGVIIMGTSMQKERTVRFARNLTKLVEKIHGPRYRSSFLQKLILGSNNNAFKDENKSNANWLTRDSKIVDEYVNNPFNTFMFTTRAYIDMFDGMLTLYNEDNLKNMRSDLPILITSGSEDPVGEMGKAVDRLARQYKELGMKNVRVIEYPGARHELLNEVNAKEVDRDILNFIEENI